MEFSLKNLERLTGGKKEDTIQLLNSFISDIENVSLPELRSALKNSDLKSTQRLAHTLKSNLSFFGLDELSEDLKHVEEKTELYSDDAGQQNGLDICLKVEEVCNHMSKWSKQNANA